jgi:hypothetical protein
VSGFQRTRKLALKLPEQLLEFEALFENERFLFVPVKKVSLLRVERE